MLPVPDLVPQFELDESPLIIQPHTPLREVALLMAQRRVKASSSTESQVCPSSYALVCDVEMLIGIITERDFVRWAAQGKRLEKHQAKEIMTERHHLVTLQHSELVSSHQIWNLLRDRNIRHLPVLEGDRIVGVATLNHLCQQLQPTQMLKMSRVRDAMSSQVLCIDPNNTVLDAAHQLDVHHGNCIVIVDSSDQTRPLGILTERDIVKLQTSDLALNTTTVKQVMSSPLCCLQPEDTLLVAQKTMQQLQVRRLVVSDDSGRLAGVLTQTHLLSILNPFELNQTVERLMSQVKTLEKERIHLLETLNQKLETQVQEKSDALSASEQRLLKTFEQAPIGIAYLDLTGTVLRSNTLLCTMLGLSVKEVVGQDGLALLTPPKESQENQGRDLEFQLDIPDSPSMLDSLLSGEQSKLTYEHCYVSPCGETVCWMQVTLSLVLDAGRQPDYLIAVVQDIGDRKAAEQEFDQYRLQLEARVAERTQELLWQASHDGLTGLVNRLGFEQEVRDALWQLKEASQTHALLYLDLDQFKIVNDTCGHAAGDELLRQVAKLFSTQVRGSDVVARIGGDEFGILLYNCAPELAHSIAENLRETVANFRFSWETQTFTIGASIGLVPLTSHSEGIEAILRAADVACYSAKEKGRNRIQCYAPDDTTLSQQRGERHWSVRLQQAMANNQFCLYEQAISRADASPDMPPSHHEILLRLVDELGKVIPPMAFLPSAERYGLMPEIDRWVIHHFLSQYHGALQQAKDCPTYMINLSGASLNDDHFLAFVREELTRYPVPPGAIAFEITETVAIANLTKAAKFMQELQTFGCSFALDDFGCGVSSFEYLKKLPVDYIKIDGDFVQDILEDKLDQTIVKFIAEIAQTLGIKTVAECVEQQVTWNRLAQLGVDYIQGYVYAKPAPIKESRDLQLKPSMEDVA